MKQAKIKFKINKILLLVLAVIIICKVSAIHVFAQADQSVSTFSEFQTAISSAPADGTKYTIKITSDMSFDSALLIPSGTNIKIISDGSGPWTLTQSGSARHFTIRGSLTLENIILDGNGTSGGLYAFDGTLEMNNGAVIKKCASDVSGSGIFLQNSTFTMNGGEISDNHQSTTYGASGGGIYLFGSTFTMNGGIITNNSSVWGGGVAVNQESTFTMNGGEISYNKAAVEYGGGVHVYVHGTFIMNDGKISNNQALNGGALGGGVFVGQGSYVSGESTDWCKFIMNGGSIEDNKAYVGGGVAAFWNGRIEMNGGSISSNEAVAGGGVYLANSQYEDNGVYFIMKGGEITGNTATSHYGGGIWAYDSGSPYTVKVVIGDETGVSTTTPLIYNNKANSQGGGIFLYGSSTHATIYEGKIYGNSTGSSGGGICVYAGSKLNMHGGLIGGENAGDANIATMSGGGIAVLGGSNTFTMTSGKIIGNIARSSSAGGGGIYLADASYSITGGEISKNTVANNGGGLYIASSAVASAAISGATISNNKADNTGGGMYNASSSTIIGDTVIRENTAISGGGLYAADDTQMKKTSITGNSAINGGGVYVTSVAVLTASDAAIFSGNRAGDEGGAIYTEDYNDYGNLTSSDYQNVRIDETTTFTNNTANAAYEPPVIVLDYANIKYRTTSIIKADNSYLHPINNYDINFVSGTPYVFYSVTYDANGGTGSHQDSGLSYETTYTVLSNDDTGISYNGYTFTGWNTEADGSGSPYKPGETFAVTTNVTLYAQWTESIDTPKTGDANLFIWVFLLFTASAMLGILFFVKRWNNKARNFK